MDKILDNLLEKGSVWPGYAILHHCGQLHGSWTQRSDYSLQSMFTNGYFGKMIIKQFGDLENNKD